MSQATADIFPIVFMYGCALLLAPFMGFALYCAFQGDKMRQAQAEAQPDVSDVAAPRAVTTEAAASAHATTAA